MSGFDCPWDSGQTGFIYASKERIKKEMGWKVITKKRIAQLQKMAQSELDEFNAYVSGDVYGFTRTIKVVDCNSCGSESEQELDSCWGFYGYSPEKLLNDVFEGKV